MTPHERTEAHFLKVAQKLKAEAGAKVLSSSGTPQQRTERITLRCSKIERIPMIEIRQIVDDIRGAERTLSAVANKRQVAAAQVEKSAQAVEDQSDNWNASAMTEQALKRSWAALQLQGSKGHEAWFIASRDPGWTPTLGAQGSDTRRQ
jgi:hypothetical protein